MVGLLLAIVAAAMMLIRIGWAGRRAIAATGWGLAAIGLALLTARDGAWGLAVGMVAGIAVALTMVLYAGWRSPAKARRAPREAPSIAIPRRWSDIARRMAVFALVVPVGFVAAQWLAFGAQALARRGGMGDADATVLTVFLQPILWTIVMAIQMTRANAARMAVPPIAAALLGTILWSVS
ncbi:hypothetical protein ASG11_00935 [Sphingomonas sp. Leaf357]|uniref:hypothetical protein n=1 Tax=Sphingomonas sp. Leaf357 TaxID=1736350 RepID=UPI0007014B7E|nr:hypothetical protein [Sphingomonas sp. Leaf357]KQS03005.1 hypothetical protein ASG11_00935 [Sphingomonas sp. Leaf357]